VSPSLNPEATRLRSVLDKLDHAISQAQLVRAELLELSGHKSRSGPLAVRVGRLRAKVEREKVIAEQTAKRAPTGRAALAAPPRKVGHWTVVGYCGPSPASHGSSLWRVRCQKCKHVCLIANCHLQNTRRQVPACKNCDLISVVGE
jgi:hypothetical protein